MARQVTLTEDERKAVAKRIAALKTAHGSYGKVSQAMTAAGVPLTVAALSQAARGGLVGEEMLGKLERFTGEKRADWFSGAPVAVVGVGAVGSDVVRYVEREERYPAMRIVFADLRALGWTEEQIDAVRQRVEVNKASAPTEDELRTLAKQVRAGLIRDRQTLGPPGEGDPLKQKPRVR